MTTVAAGATLTLTGSSSQVLVGRTLTNLGQAVWNGNNDLVLYNGAEFINGPKATFTALNDQNINNSGGAAAFINNGTFIKSPGSGTTSMGVLFTNTGTINLQTGTLSLVGGLNRLSGAVIGSGTLDFGSSYSEITGVFNIAGTATIGGSATVVVDGSSKVHILNQSGGYLTGQGNLTITGVGAQLNWTGGTEAGTGTTTVAAGAALNLNGSSYMTLDARTLTNLGQATWSGANDLYLEDGAVLVNGLGATFMVQNDRTIFYNGGVNPIFTNAGTFTKQTTTGTTTVSVTVNDTGTVNVQSGTLSLTEGVRSPGLLTVASGATLNIPNGVNVLGEVGGAGDVSLSGGSTTVTGTYDLAGTTTIGGDESIQFLGNGNSGPVSNSGQVIIGTASTFKVTGNFTQLSGGSTRLDGGTLALLGANSLLDIQAGGQFAGLGLITGAVSNAGTLNVGGQGLIGTLAVTGSFTQLAAGTTNINIGGKSTASQFDQLAISGAAVFDGLLNVNLINGFTPPSGSDSWKIFKYASHTGAFATTNVPSGFALQYNATDGSIA